MLSDALPPANKKCGNKIWINNRFIGIIFILVNTFVTLQTKTMNKVTKINVVTGRYTFDSEYIHLTLSNSPFIRIFLHFMLHSMNN